MMDVIITYVDGMDPLWRESYRQTLDVPVLEKRFRDWGTLKYLLRGIQKYMPYVEKVHLVVASESQVPDWVNRDEVDVVLHNDIIPQDMLPLFNSGSIEMFLHRIKGLSEEYIYFNDDCFPLKLSSRKDFFVQGRPQVYLSKHILRTNLFKKGVKHSDELARKAAGVSSSIVMNRPQHAPTPMLKSICEELYDTCRDEILASITPLRSLENYSQYLFTDYAFYKGLTDRKRLSNKHFSMAVASADKIAAYIDDPQTSFVCINDVTMSEEMFNKSRTILLEAFEHRFPERSRFEN